MHAAYAGLLPTVLREPFEKMRKNPLGRVVRVDVHEILIRNLLHSLDLSDRAIKQGVGRTLDTLFSKEVCEVKWRPYDEQKIPP